MPTLFRFLMTLAILAGIVYGAMVALVIYVKPQQAEMSYRIPADRLNRPVQTAAPASIATGSPPAPGDTASPAAPVGAAVQDQPRTEHSLPPEDTRQE